ncbi:MAG TPA: hypothetical protein DEG06_00160 [Lachnospiraceae bacterium]|nr:hypothetical protein [Lachnospiraceae bacterium]HBY70635.1 hypothetical protein [Lachnospiraceae bacterium]HCM13847.1 hypothetical protein [Lachnospiraceae bacterium]HCR40607.1 hypothetical protein [Lachnospiraceae bacterium]
MMPEINLLLQISKVLLYSGEKLNTEFHIESNQHSDLSRKIRMPISCALFNFKENILKSFQKGHITRLLDMFIQLVNNNYIHWNHPFQ